MPTRMCMRNEDAQAHWCSVRCPRLAPSLCPPPSHARTLCEAFLHLSRTFSRSRRTHLVRPTREACGDLGPLRSWSSLASKLVDSSDELGVFLLGPPPARPVAFRTSWRLVYWWGSRRHGGWTGCSLDRGRRGGEVEGGESGFEVVKTDTDAGVGIGEPRHSGGSVGR